MPPPDTIAAISTPVAPSPRIILRITGPRAHPISASLAQPLPPAGAARARLRFAGLSVPIWLYAFQSPSSYTGEDLIEFHLPGNVLLARMLLAELIRLGARPADPGEFTARAYFNGRMDLAEAEGVAAAISAHGQDELLAARQLLAGELSRRLRPIMDDLAQILALIEVGIDFSEEQVTFLPPDQIVRRSHEIIAALDALVAGSARFERLAHEPQFVLVGRPNAGKSTLLNALAGHSRAVVSPIAGTTRDILSAEISLDRGLVRLLDAAGLAEHLPSPHDASPPARIERQMHAHALAAIEAADFILLLHDSTDPSTPLIPPRPPDLILLTKTDLLAHASSPNLSQKYQTQPKVPAIPLSAHTNLNLDTLRRHMSSLAFGRGATSASSLALNTRHLQSISDARAALIRAQDTAARPADELIALELRDALDSLGQILGHLTPDHILSKIFSTFCIGK